jgi:hypothetical protein
VGTRYEYFEARKKMPPGPGTRPAFWLALLRPAASPEPGVEVDVIKYYGRDPFSSRANLHVWQNEKENMGIGTKIDAPDRGLVEDYQTFGVEWLADR